MWKKCPKCNTEFDSDKKHKLYCSKDCSRKADLDNHKRWYYMDTEKPCAVCGEMFIPNRKRRYNCSDECSKKAKEISYKNYRASMKAMIRIYNYSRSEQAEKCRKAYKARPEYNYYAKLWKCGLSVKDIKREKRS